MKWRGLVVVAVLLWPISAFAEETPRFMLLKTGNDLFDDCSAPPGSARYALCLGYISGVADGLTPLKNVWKVCPSESVRGDTAY